MYAIRRHSQPDRLAVALDDDPGVTDDEDVARVDPPGFRQAGAVKDEPRATRPRLREDFSFRKAEVAHGLGLVNARKLYVSIRPPQRQGKLTHRDTPAASDIFDVDW